MADSTPRVNLAAFAEVKCRFGCDEVAGIFHVPGGCVCWPDPVQALCGQHAIRAQSEGPITLLVGDDPRGWGLGHEARGKFSPDAEESE